MALLIIPPSEGGHDALLTAAGIALVVAAESLRLWAVHHIGAISRTRSDRLGPLVSTGPFALVRNPLYLGNIALWIGFAMSARTPWLVPVFLVVLALEYHAIVQWEEALLMTRRGADYLAYAARVPRWVPTLGAVPGSGTENREPYSWHETLFSERGTLIAIAIGYLVLWMKNRMM